MAHAGKIWPVWFRRDFSVNRLNFQGFARQYWALVGDFVTNTQPGPIGFNWIYTNDQKEGWTGIANVGGFKPAQLSLTV